MAKFAACNAGAEAEVTYADSIVFIQVCKVVISFCHSAYKDTYAFPWSQVVDVVSHAYSRSIEAQSDLSAIRRKMVCYWILDNLKQLLLRCS